MNGEFVFRGNMIATADQRMNNETVKDLWKSFSLGGGELCIHSGECLTFSLGETSLPTLSEDKEYALRVDERGAAVVGRDYGGLMRGFLCLLMKIEYEGSSDLMKISAVEEESAYLLKNRMIHLCVFPENDLYFIKKQIRMAGLCQYTHVVIEFWGMLRYDCLKELSWPHAFTKEEVSDLIRECREFGMEPIPMVNQLGHATSCRVKYGKHVVLDQNPKLQRLFTPDGWAWDITSEEVWDLFKNIRRELCELFGEGEYFHIGCDEAYYITRNDSLRQALPDYFGRLTREVEKEGRRPMMWMDMLLEEKVFPDCYTVGKAGEVVALRNATAPSTVFVDWQYRCYTAPIPSLASLAGCGRDVMGAPWYEETNYTSHVETIMENQLFGIMMTTWHTLKEYMPSILGCAKKCGAQSFVWSKFSRLREESATMLRRISYEGNDYASSGWSKEQIEV